jgi:hypothetical protein
VRLAAALCLAGAVLCSAGTDARALAIYQYVGPSFDAFVDNAEPPGSYDSSMRVTATIVLAAPLAPNSGFDICCNPLTPLAYSFHDGRQTLTELNSIAYFIGQTDGTGAIQYWEMTIIESSAGGVITINNSPLSEEEDFVLDRGELGNTCSAEVCEDPGVGDTGSFLSSAAADAGTWTLVPEPSTAALLALGLLVLARRR